jgi:hypothetical protein
MMGLQKILLSSMVLGAGYALLFPTNSIHRTHPFATPSPTTQHPIQTQQKQLDTNDLQFNGTGGRVKKIISQHSPEHQLEAFRREMRSLGKEIKRVIRADSDIIAWTRETETDPISHGILIRSLSHGQTVSYRSKTDQSKEKQHGGFTPQTHRPIATPPWSEISFEQRSPNGRRHLIIYESSWVPEKLLAHLKAGFIEEQWEKIPISDSRLQASFHLFKKGDEVCYLQLQSSAGERSSGSYLTLIYERS